MENFQLEPESTPNKRGSILYCALPAVAFIPYRTISQVPGSTI